MSKSSASMREKLPPLHARNSSNRGYVPLPNSKAPPSKAAACTAKPHTGSQTVRRTDCALHKRAPAKYSA